MTYQNGQIELALAKVCQIPATEIGALKGKLRYFRRLGIPRIEKVGSGHRANFSFLDMLKMRVAVELSNIGVKPAAIRKFIDEEDRDWTDYNIVFRVSPVSSITVNLTKIIRELDGVL